MEAYHRREVTALLGLILLTSSTSIVQSALGQNSSSDVSNSLQEEMLPKGHSDMEQSDLGGDEGGSGAYDNSTQTSNSPPAGNASSTAQTGNSTDTSSEQMANDASQQQNSTSVNSGPPEETETSSQSQNSTDTQENAQQSQPSNSTGSSDQEQQSGNNTSTNVTQNQNQNSTSDQNGHEDFVDSTGSNNTAYTGNQTETSSQYSNNYTQTLIENANITATATSNSTTINQNTTIALLPDYDIDIDPLFMNISAGSSATYTITITSVDGFNSNVSLAIASKSVPAITASLSSNMTLVPVNGSSISILTVQTDSSVPSGEYKLKVTGSSANFKDKSVSVKLEVIGQNVTAPEEPQFDPVALTSVLIKDMQDNILDEISSNKMVLISTTVTNNYDKSQPFIVVVEVRDVIGTTLYLQLQKGVLNPLGEVEVAISWTPDEAGTYQVRTFAIDEIREDPEPLSVPVGKTVEVK